VGDAFWDSGNPSWVIQDATWLRELAFPIVH
jgi:hypothetical protein